jgi:hypothetical protein
MASSAGDDLTLQAQRGEERQPWRGGIPRLFRDRSGAPWLYTVLLFDLARFLAPAHGSGQWHITLPAVFSAHWIFGGGERSGAHDAVNQEAQEMMSIRTGPACGVLDSTTAEWDLCGKLWPTV